MTYDNFASECTETLQRLQADLAKKYEIDWYENWFYNDATGLFTLSTDEKEVNFRYLSIGTFSRNTNTWKWAWDKDETDEQTKEKLQKVMEYGRAHHYDKLFLGHFPADEIDGWEFAGIAAKILGGIGAYRAVDEHLLIFLLITDHVPNDAAKEIKNAFVSCGIHGYRRRAFICKHLHKNIKTGFHESFETTPGMELGPDDDFEAWCDLCEVERLRTDGWNDDSMAFANIRLVCENCFFDIKGFNLGYQ